MSNSATCKYCGASNPSDRPNCWKCGAWFAFDSTRGPGPTLQGPAQDVKVTRQTLSPSPWVDPYPTFDDATVKGAHDTDRGLLLLAIGLIVGVLPVIGILGVILALVGAVFVIIGRDAFGDRHAKFVIVSTVVYVLFSIVTFGIGASIVPSVQSIFSSTTGPASLSAQLTNLINSYIIAEAIVGAVIGLSTVFFTYPIQNHLGRVLLWLAFAISLLLLIPAFILVNQLPLLINQAVATSDPSALYSWLNQIQAFRLLSIIPAIFYALGYLNARARITNGEIPY